MTKNFDQLTDELILKMMKESHPETVLLFEIMYDRYAERVQQYYQKRQCEKSVMDDLTQETFIQLFKKRTRYRENTPAAAWIFIIAKTVFRDWLRQNKKYEQSHFDRLTTYDQREPQNWELDDGLNWLEDLGLSEQELAILYDRFVLGFSFRELEAKWQESAVSLRKRVSRLYRKIRDRGNAG